MTDGNAEAIASAPTDIAYLLDLAEACRRLVEQEPIFYPATTNGTLLAACLLCDADASDAEAIQHAPDCPWRQARELLAARAEAG